MVWNRPMFKPSPTVSIGYSQIALSFKIAYRSNKTLNN